MRLGIDARKLFDGGIGTYIRELLAGLGALPDGPEITAFVRPEAAGAVKRLCPRAAEMPLDAGLYSLAEHLTLPRAARRAGIELFHAPHYTLPLGWTGRAAVTIHDLTHIRYARFFPPGTGLYARLIAGAAARRAHRVIADSEFTRGDVVGYLGVDPSRVRVVPLGVSATFRPPPRDAVEEFRRRLGLPADYLLYVGARKRHKNLELLLEALARISPPRGPVLVLSGPPWRSSEPLAMLAARLGVTSAILFRPVNDPSELVLLYGGAALYVHPALTEGFGLPPLEAMACGVPVLSSDAGALPEALGDAATFLAPEDPDAWAHSIEALLADRPRRAELTRRGLEHAGRMTWARTVAGTMAVYREAAEDR